MPDPSLGRTGLEHCDGFAGDDFADRLGQVCQHHRLGQYSSFSITEPDIQPQSRLSGADRRRLAAH